MPVLAGFEMTGVGEPLRAVDKPLTAPGPGEARVRVAGCGLCHTDLGFLYDGVRTRHPLPLILGHEISGVVEAVGAGAEAFEGRAVVVPAVLPCGTCAACRSGRSMVCKAQIMPGNDVDGGFASHVTVPARWLCPVEGGEDFDAQLGGVSGLTLRHLAVVADAVSTPYQAAVRAELAEGDLAVVIGLGGVGGYAVQIARALGAHVVGIDVDEAKLARAEALGCSAVFDPRATASRDLRKQVRAFAKEAGAAPFGAKIFECSGTAAGQTTAWGLLGHGATLAVVGYTMDKVEVRLSNLMAFDARAIGNWGCDPALYPDIVRMVLDGRIDVVSHTEIRPLSSLVDAMESVHAGQVASRLVLAPVLP